MLKLVELKTVGVGEHRSGWPYCVKALAPLLHPAARTVLDGFVERTFLYNYEWHRDTVHTSPWVGVMHHPPDMPSWYMPHAHLQQLLTHNRFQASLPQLQLIISMGDNLTMWCKEQWPHIPVVTIRHPTGRPLVEWSPARFYRNQHKQVVQVGWFMRNTAAIYQVAVAQNLHKTHLQQTPYWVKSAHAACGEMYKHRKNIGKTAVISPVGALQYDLLLAENVVFMETISAVANNTVVECIARNTPICVNRQAGPVYYLGDDYPLYYEQLGEVKAILTTKNILAAHAYLQKMDKWWIRGEMFCAQVRLACQQYVAGCEDLPAPSREVQCVIH